MVCVHDVIACAALPALDSIVVPKVESAADLEFVDCLLDGAEFEIARCAPIRIQALIESARGLANIESGACASPRLETLIIGYADLAVSLQRTLSSDQAAWAPIQDRVLVAARAANLDAIDGPYLAVDSGATFTKWLDDVCRRGFAGKRVIHPSQIEAVHAAFSPTATEIEWAHAVITALDHAAAYGQGVAAMDGHMIDEAVILSAHRILAAVPE